MQTYRVKSGDMSVEVDAEDPREAALAALQLEKPDMLGVSVEVLDEERNSVFFETDYLLLDLDMFDLYN